MRDWCSANLPRVAGGVWCVVCVGIVLVYSPCTLHCLPPFLPLLLGHLAAMANTSIHHSDHTIIQVSISRSHERWLVTQRCPPLPLLPPTPHQARVTAAHDPPTPQLYSPRGRARAVKDNVKAINDNTGQMELGDVLVGVEVFKCLKWLVWKEKSVQKWATWRLCYCLQVCPRISDRLGDRPNTLDHIFSSDPSAYSVRLYSPLGSSDHNLFSVFCPIAPVQLLDPQKKRCFWHYDSPRCEDKRQYLPISRGMITVSGSGTPLCTQRITDVVVSAMEVFIPHTFSTPNAKKNWFNHACSRAIKERGTRAFQRLTIMHYVFQHEIVPNLFFDSTNFFHPQKV